MQNDNNPRPAVQSEPDNTQTASPVSSTAGETTTVVNTPTTGVIHGTRIEALRIIAGSTFPVADNAFVRLSPGETDDATQFNVAIDPDSIDVRPYDGTDCVIGGVYDELFTPEHGATDTRTRVEFQPPYEARHAFQDVKDDQPGSKHAEYRNNCVPRWNVTDEWVDYVTEAVLDDGFAIVTRLSTLRSLYTAHPDHTISDSGQYIITDDAHVDPDYYETENPRPEAGHGKGGNPHDAYHFLETGECPAEDCDDTFDTWRSLRSHVGGKASPNDTPEQNAHDQLNIRLNEITVTTVPDTQGDQ